MDIPYIDEWYRDLEHRSPESILEWALDHFDAPLFSTSLGPEDQVLTHIIAGLSRPIRIITLDTGRLFESTLDLLERTRTRYGLEIEVKSPAADELEPLVTQHGPNLFRHSVEWRQACCKVRKVLPLRRSLQGQNAWITGLRRDQTQNRAELRPIEWDNTFNIVKINPLWNWSESAVWQFLLEQDVPTNPLHQAGYPSIGCAPCTRAIEPGEDSRAGRWWWESKGTQECGLHLVDGKLVRVKALSV